jgi:hypothetical protein
MYGFIVLGYVPGTHLELGFQAVLNIYGAALAVVAYKWISNRNHRFAAEPVLQRQVMHANQLHQRA